MKGNHTSMFLSLSPSLSLSLEINKYNLKKSFKKEEGAVSLGGWNLQILPRRL